MPQTSQPVSLLLSDFLISPDKEWTPFTVSVDSTCKELSRIPAGIETFEHQCRTWINIKIKYLDDEFMLKFIKIIFYVML